MGNPNQHDHDPLPMLLAGGGSGRLQGGRHIRVADGHAGREPAASTVLRQARRAGRVVRRQHRRARDLRRHDDIESSSRLDVDRSRCARRVASRSGAPRCAAAQERRSRRRAGGRAVVAARGGRGARRHRGRPRAARRRRRRRRMRRAATARRRCTGSCAPAIATPRERLLAAGADVNAANRYGVRPLHSRSKPATRR